MQNLDTLLIHPDIKKNPLGALAFPIFQTSTYENEFMNEGKYSYSRCSNPTRTELERVAALAENGKYCSAFSSGLSAINAVFSLVHSGEHILVSADIYGGTYRLLNEFIKKNGITITFCDASDTNKFCALLRPETTLVFIETPTNPLMKVTDIYEISSKIGKKAILACDNTFLSPVFQKPLDLGADISIHSATKYICGHHDTSAGLVITNNYDIAEKISFALRTHGSGLSPFDSFLVRRGFETLCLRMERHNQNSLKVFEFLTHCKEIEKIYYVGDKNHPDYAVTQKQTSGFGGMLSFVFCKGYEVKEFINRLKLIIFAESLGGNSSLITHPYTQTHASLPVEVRLKNGITPMLLRLSVGTENANDIICDIKEAL